MKSRKSLIDVLGIALGVLAIALVALSLVYLIGYRPLWKGFRYLGPRHWGWGGWGRGWESEEATEEVQGGFTRLEVNNVAGPIQIEGWDQDYIEVHYVKQARTRQALANFPVEMDKSGDTLSIRPVYQPLAGPMFGSVSFEIKVPSSLAYVKAHNVSGGISLSHLASDVEQELETVSGSIETERSGDLRAKSTSGSIEFSFSGRRLEANSISGRIKGQLRNLAKDGSVDIQTVSGSVNLESFQGLDASLRLSSVSGSISCDFPVQVAEKKEHRLEGKIGQGSVPFNVKTVSGSIQLEQD